MTLLFVIIVATFHGALLGQKYNFGSVAGLSIVVLVVSLALVQLEFWICCAFYLVSRNIIVRWKRCAISSCREYSKYLLKVLKSLPIIAMPVGNVGIMDLEVKMNFMHRLMGTIVDGMIIKTYLLV